MNKSDQQLEKYDVVARMFELINNLSEDQQIILLKQLVKDSVVAQLGKLIVDMPKKPTVNPLKTNRRYDIRREKGPFQKTLLNISRLCC